MTVAELIEALQLLPPTAEAAPIDLITQGIVIQRAEDAARAEVFVRIYDRVVRRFWAGSEPPLSEDEFRKMVEAEGLTYPANRDVKPAQHLCETWAEFQERAESAKL